MKNNKHLPHKLMVLIALVQGLCLLYLHQAIELNYWPHNSPHWLFALYSIAFIWPVMLLLSLKPTNITTVVKYTVPFALLSGLLGYYVGYQATPIEHIRYDALLFSYVLTMAIATFKALMYSQQIAAGERINYSSLFLWSWRNFLTLSLSLLFAGSFWLILILWGQLFKAINIHFFKELFEEPWFYYPAIALANGFGIIIFRKLTHIIDTITRLQQALMKFLLILLIFISILFLCALPFTGLEPLWKGGGSALILWMQALMLFFVNAVYQDDPEQRPYTLWLHRFVYVGIALLPIYSMISFYGLSLRVEQYGWTLDRCWAYLIWFLLALFPLGYWWGIAKKRDYWVQQLSRVNITAGLVILGMMMLINSPLLDFRKIVVNDQLQRLANNKIKLDDFDISYFRRHLAKPGYEGLQMIKEQYGKNNPNIIVQINELYRDRKNNKPASTKEEFTAAITILAGEPPSQLFDAIYEHNIKHSWRMRNAKKYYLQPLDLNEDSQLDYLLVSQENSGLYLTLYYFEEVEWKNINLTSIYQGRDKTLEPFIKALKAGDINIIRPKWNYIEVLEKQIRIQEK